MKASTFDRIVGTFWGVIALAYAAMAATAMVADQPHELLLVKAFVFVAFARIAFLEAKVEDGQ